MKLEWIPLEAFTTCVFSHTEQPPAGELLPASGRDNKGLWLLVGRNTEADTRVVAERKTSECVHSRSACILQTAIEDFLVVMNII